MQTRQKYARTDMIDYKSIFPKREYSRVVLCIAIFFYLLICYNGLWNMALYPAEAKYTDTIIPFLEICQMLTPATMIVISFGALSVLELVCTVQDNAWKTVMEMILWSLLTVLMNSFIAYQMSLGNNAGLGTWMILITTSVVNIVWYISTITYGFNGKIKGVSKEYSSKRFRKRYGKHLINMKGLGMLRGQDLE